jgi:hypothetical protein
MSDVRLVRMKSGEELIGKIKDTDTGCHLDDVLILVPTGEGSIGLMPYMPYTNAAAEGIDIPQDFVLFVLTLAKELENHYTAQFSKLVVPNGPQGQGLVGANGLKLSN